jgi:hypothetical protein
MFPLGWLHHDRGSFGEGGDIQRGASGRAGLFGGFPLLAVGKSFFSRKDSPIGGRHLLKKLSGYNFSEQSSCKAGCHYRKQKVKSWTDEHITSGLGICFQSDSQPMQMKPQEEL